MIELSVIVPIYNTAPYLERCVRSLMEQTLTEGVEFIFINDGSTDGSDALLHSILSEYPVQTCRVKILTTPQNRGSGAARAWGLQLAEGMYVTHCDSDDYLEKNACEIILSHISGYPTDLILADFNTHKHDQQEIYRYPDLTIEQRLQQGHWWMQWSHTIKRSLLTAHNLTTVQGINFWEDMDFLMRVYHFARSVSYLHVPIYHYDQTHTNSLSRDINLAQRQIDCNRVIAHLTAFYAEQGSVEPIRMLDLQRYTRDLYLQQSPIDWTRWRRTYPRSWRYLWHDPQFKFAYRLTYTLASWGLLAPFRFYLYCSRKKCH